MSDVDLIVCITESQGSPYKGNLKIKGRIIDVSAQVLGERALVGSVVQISYSGNLLPNMVIKVGILFRVSLPLETANAALDDIANGVPPEYTISFTPNLIRPMTEPCVRVPLSLLRDLRGQESFAEMTRRALIKTWSEDRRTGKDKVNKA